MKIISFLVTTLIAFATHASFVSLPDGLEMYREHFPAPAGGRTVVLVNGLTYTTQPWSKTVATLREDGFGVLVYDPRGMGQTLEKNGRVTEVLPLDQQVKDLEALLTIEKLDRVAIAGLSYGGAVALRFAELYPERVTQLIPIAPYVKALSSLDRQVLQKVRMHRLTKPSDKRSDDELYDLYLQETIYQTYPYFEPVVKEHPWRLEAIYNMVRGVRKFLGAESVRGIRNVPIHLIQAGSDQYVRAADLNEFWAAIPPQLHGSRMTVEGSEHKIPEVTPKFLAAWIGEILKENALLVNGRDFRGRPRMGDARARDASISNLHRD